MIAFKVWPVWCAKAMLASIVRIWAYFIRPTNPKEAGFLPGSGLAPVLRGRRRVARECKSRGGPMPRRCGLLQGRAAVVASGPDRAALLPGKLCMCVRPLGRRRSCNI